LKNGRFRETLLLVSCRICRDFLLSNFDQNQVLFSESMKGHPSNNALPEAIEQIYRNDARKVFATLVRLLGDFDLAEEAMHEAFAVAVQQWPSQGIPTNPSAWLVSTGRFKALDVIRRRTRLNELQGELAQRIQEVQAANEAIAEQEVKDDRLRLIFTCCHPAIDPRVQVPLTLREVCGMTTEEIASAFLTTPATMAQRIVRGKAKIREAKIPYVVPSRAELPERLDAVLAVIYLVFNEGYSASSAESLIRKDLSDEAIRLARLILELLPDPNVMGLLALMLLHESRRTARLTPEGEIILLEDQDRSKWDQALIAEGLQLVEASFATRQFGSYALQAAISAVHAEASTAATTDWRQMVALYDLLMRFESSPIVELNRAVAVTMVDGPAAGLALVDHLLSRGELADYHLAHAARADFQRRLRNFPEAITSYQKALSLAKQPSERRFLQRRLSELL
jgi:RNA polymerase sigma-70 factor, ECF subfamily